MLDNLFGNQISDLQSALGRTAKRHGALSDNIANINTPGYKRKDVDFNIVLSEAMNTPGKARMRDLQEQAAQRASDSTSLRADGNNVDMERETFALAETQLRYEALTDMTAGYFSNLKSVIREGK